MKYCFWDCVLRESTNWRCAKARLALCKAMRSLAAQHPGRVEGFDFKAGGSNDIW